MGKFNDDRPTRDTRGRQFRAWQNAYKVPAAEVGDLMAKVQDVAPSFAFGLGPQRNGFIEVKVLYAARGADTQDIKDMLRDRGVADYELVTSSLHWTWSV